MAVTDFSVFQIERLPAQRIARVWLNKPDRKNAMDTDFWSYLPALATHRAPATMIIRKRPKWKAPTICAGAFFVFNCNINWTE